MFILVKKKKETSSTISSNNHAGKPLKCYQLVDFLSRDLEYVFCASDRLLFQCRARFAPKENLPVDEARRMYSPRVCRIRVGVKNVSRRKWRIDRTDISRRARTPGISCTRISNPKCRETPILSRRPICIYVCVWTWPREILEIARRQREPRLHKNMRGMHYAWFCRRCTSAERIDDTRYLRSDVSLVAKVHARRLRFNPKRREKLRGKYLNTRKFLGKSW